ncbi:transcriptional regulator [Deinococcus seoulensis]|uniref:Transcriptional regulator n=1 Tax=Deinococcus seoulensis TaxID=1837379 RepID=A0ABQ2RNR0_9DEIO|nr:response regulator [Deinococcus seoulensis]GGR53022.1 transcriptional regulator [Deinococcus seoulensis]
MNPSDLPPTPTTILVVDDSVSVRKALERILAPQGYVVRMADSAENALLNLEPLPDMILADILMPGMSGLELARILGDRQLNIPVMLMSGIVDDVTQRDASNAGACGVLRKPFTPTELLPAIEPHLQAALARRQDTPASSDPVPAVSEPAPVPAPQAAAAPAVPAPAAPVPASPAPAAPTHTHSGPLASLRAVPGVLGAVLYDADGERQDAFGEALSENFGMYARFLVTAAATASFHLNRGDLSGVQVTYGQQTLLLTPYRDGQLVTLLAAASDAAAVHGWQGAQLN